MNSSKNKIRILSDLTINKMAAGEVIENPASVVKELVENAIDASAQHICVEIREGGRDLIRVSDDGCGMSEDDALLCLERHATSKIQNVEDLEEILTMGFRGEAIPSIAAISKFSILTCPVSGKGTLIIVEGGKLISSSNAQRSPGTTIEVKSLFFNVPVRRKFQKSPNFDIQEILKIVSHLALAYPKIHFELVSDQKVLLKTSLNANVHNFNQLLGSRLEILLGKDTASNILPLTFQEGSYELEGYIGSSLNHKPNRTGQHLFINQRLVNSSLVSQAIREGYGTILPNHRFPVFVLHLRMPGSLLDVNVHPQKREVRLRQELELKETIIRAIEFTLRQDQNLPKINIPISEENHSVPPFWGPYASLLSPFVKENADTKWEYQSTIKSDSPSTSHLQTISDHQQENRLNENPFFEPPYHQQIVEIKTPSFILPKTPKILATIVNYCILEPFNLDKKLFGNSIENTKEGGLAVLDQRAAFTRIYFERLTKETYKNESQSLLIPYSWHMAPNEAEIVREYVDLFNKMGFGLREFGTSTFVVDAIPPLIHQNDLQNFLTLILEDLIEVQSSRRLQIEKEEYLALSASRATLPKAKRLTIQEGEFLLKELISCEIIDQCPNGKPTCFYLSSDEMSKLLLKKR